MYTVIVCICVSMSVCLSVCVSLYLSLEVLLEVECRQLNIDVVVLGGDERLPHAVVIWVSEDLLLEHTKGEREASVDGWCEHCIVSGGWCVSGCVGGWRCRSGSGRGRRDSIAVSLRRRVSLHAHVLSPYQRHGCICLI